MRVDIVTKLYIHGTWVTLTKASGAWLAPQKIGCTQVFHIHPRHVNEALSIKGR